ncbi:hypothetical protein [Salinibacterium sp. ZJ450]|uniref:hypothetical protein n=1 Tax=Salinibacterium sp. ZJ450 TaxID=2708338 RepID=UPI0014218D71|nr:hypothetical protein [Salinibacterium sp. ZJ450]
MEESKNGEWWSHAIGPFYVDATLIEHLGIDAGTLAGMVARREILALPIEGELVYPSLQFEGAQLPPRLAEYLAAADPENGWPWETALRALTTNAFWDGRSPVQILRAGDTDDVAHLLLETERTYASVTGP